MQGKYEGGDEKEVGNSSPNKWPTANLQLAGVHRDENIVKSLYTFASAHNALLTWVGYQALQIKRLPANARQNAVLVEVSHQSRPAESSRL